MNRIKEFLKSKEINGLRFIPGKKFYKIVGIGQIRFGQILRNEKEPTIKELQAIAKYFNVDITELYTIKN
jgi:transcriptional regulator with XRE-family HTH domain